MIILFNATDVLCTHSSATTLNQIPQIRVTIATQLFVGTQVLLNSTKERNAKHSTSQFLSYYDDCAYRWSTGTMGTENGTVCHPDTNRIYLVC